MTTLGLFVRSYYSTMPDTELDAIVMTTSISNVWKSPNARTFIVMRISHSAVSYTRVTAAY